MGLELSVVNEKFYVNYALPVMKAKSCSTNIIMLEDSPEKKKHFGRKKMCI